MMKKHVFFLLIGLLTIGKTAVAYSFSAVAPSGQTLYYYISGTTVTVTFPGFSTSATYSGYTEPTGNLNIPSSVTYNGVTYSVTGIDNYAFYGCSGLTSVTIPNSVTGIDNCAFYGCSGLTTPNTYW
jgi:hypothetical protein